jgi:hypothetical protein
MGAQNISSDSRQTPVELADINVEGELMPSALKHIAEAYRAVIGLEYSLEAPYDRGLSIHLKHASLTTALDAVVKAQPRFSWQATPDGAIRVFTADAPTLPDVVVGTLEVKNLNLSMSEDSLDRIPEVAKWLRDNGYTRSEVVISARVFALDPSGKPLPSPEDSKLSFTIHGKTFGEDLNEIARRYGLHFWAISVYSRHRVSVRIPRASEY